MPPLFQVLVLLAAAIVAVPAFRAARVGPVLGYLVAGMVVGPHGLKLIPEVEQVRRLGEFGVVFLLFAIGLELKLARLLAMRRLVFGLGGAQVLVTGAVLAILVWLLAPVGWPLAAVVGAGLALSSTAVVLQTLMDRGELGGRAGRVTFAILLMQDLAVVPVLVMVDAISGGGNGDSPPELALAAMGKALLAGMAIVVVGRLLARPFLRLMASAHSPEVFAAAALLVVLGTAWATEQAGLSMALGAFMAGLLLAETEYRHQIEADIQPFRGFLMGLFFMAVGMSLDLGLLARDLGVILGLLAALMLLKAAIVTALALAFRLGAAVAAHAGMLLAQGGEFAFVVFAQATAKGILPPELIQPLTLAVSASMMVTPVLAAAAPHLVARLHRRPTHDEAGLESVAGIRDHVIVAGFGRVGQTVARMLARQAIPYLAVDLAHDRVLAARSGGLPVDYGEASRAEVLRAAGAERARALVLTLDRSSAAERTVAEARQHFPELPIFARARDSEHGARLLGNGATAIVPETIEASLQLGAMLLQRGLGVTDDEIRRLLDLSRREDYAGMSVKDEDEGRDENGRK